MMIFRFTTHKGARALALVIGAFLLCSCSTVRLDLRDARPSLCLNDPVETNVQIVKHIHRKVSAHFGLFGLVTWKNPDFQKVLAEEMTRYGGNAVINVTIESDFGPGDVILGLPLFPVWFMRSYTLEGDVVIMQPVTHHRS